MPVTRTLLLACTVPLLILSACAAEKSEEAAATPEQAASSADAAGPDIARSVAPGVAFNLAYAFTLPAKTIPDIQQQHAAACAKLGTNRCRVTGVNFDQSGEDQASGRMDFLLAPDIAHSFASTATRLVEQADGKLDQANVTGENAGDQISLSQQDSAALQAEIKRIEARLAARGLTPRERAELQRQLGDLNREIDGQVNTRNRLEKAIATTPVSFSYASEGLIGGSGTFAKAASASWSSVEALLGFVAFIAGVALPWLLLIGLIVAIARSPLVRRLTGKTPPAEAAAPQ